MWAPELTISLSLWKEMWWHYMYFINKTQNYLSCRKFCENDSWNFWKGEYITIYNFFYLPFGSGQSSFCLKIKYIMYCLAGCFSLFKSLFDLIKQLFGSLGYKLASLHLTGFVSKILIDSLLTSMIF